MTSTKETKTAAEIIEMLPARMISTVVRGFGRGSKDLGIPTANLDLTNPSVDDFPCGIYWGYARVGVGPTLTAAISVGYNPTYGNTVKTVEPHLIAPDTDPRRRASSTGETVLTDFYDETIRLSIVGYLRPELPFEGLDKLVQAIKVDIQNSVELAKNYTGDERDWVDSKCQETAVNSDTRDQSQ